MRFLILAVVVGLAGCDTEFTVPNASPNSPLATEKPTITRSAEDGTAAYRRVAQRVEPYAEKVCRDLNPNANRLFCDFRMALDRRTNQPPNAFQSRDRSGQPVITFNINILRTIRNDDEIAFIIGHEAGHQIANHLTLAQRNTALCGIVGAIGARILGGNSDQIQQAATVGLAVGSRAFSKDLELEADVLGTYIAEGAGYDPRRGAQSFARFSGGGGFLSTHPPSGQRVATVNKVADRIDAQRAAGITPVPARN